MTNDQPQVKIIIFGKPGCDKCAVLEKRVDSLLTQKKWRDFSKVKFDLESEDGLVEFCSLECLNPQRVPAFVITGRHPENGEFIPLPNRRQSADQSDICGDSRLHSWLGLQTDYSEKGGGVISKKMITAVLEEARKTAPKNAET